MQTYLRCDSRRRASPQEEKNSVRNCGAISQQFLFRRNFGEQDKQVDTRNAISSGRKGARQEREFNVEVKGRENDEQKVCQQNRRCERTVWPHERCVNLQQNRERWQERLDGDTLRPYCARDPSGASDGPVYERQPPCFVSSHSCKKRHKRPGFPAVSAGEGHSSSRQYQHKEARQDAQEYDNPGTFTAESSGLKGL